MANPTTNFGWVMPTATDLVTDLPADFAVFGQGVDTSMAYLLGGTTGQILSKTSATNMAFTWINNDQGDITGITATSPLTGGGSSGAITVGIQDATTSVKGSVQLSDSISTTSSVLAATPTAVKSAYDLANGAIEKTTVTTAGDVIYRNATVPARLGIGTVGQVLTVNSGATAPEWTTPAAGGGLTLLGTSIPSAATSVSFTGIAATYKHLLVTWSSINGSATTANWNFRFNADSTSIYNSFYAATGTFTQDQNLSSICPTLSVFGTDPQGSGVANSMYGYLWIYNYSDTAVNKPFSGAGSYYSGSGWRQVASLTGAWNSTAAITSVDLTRTSGSGTISATTNGFIKLWGMA